VKAERVPPDCLGRRVLWLDEKGALRTGVVYRLRTDGRPDGRLVSFPDPYPLLRPYQLKALKELAFYYLVPPAKLLWDFLPSVFKNKEKLELVPGRLTPLEPTTRKLYELFKERGRLPYRTAVNLLGEKTVTFLVKKGYLKVERKTLTRKVVFLKAVKEPVRLRSEEKKALLELVKSRPGVTLEELLLEGFKRSAVNELIKKGYLSSCEPPPYQEGRPQNPTRSVYCLSFKEAVERLKSLASEALGNGRPVFVFFTDGTDAERAAEALKPLKPVLLEGSRLYERWFLAYGPPRLFLGSFSALFLPLPQGSLRVLFNELGPTRYPRNLVDARRVLGKLSTHGFGPVVVLTPWVRLETYNAFKKGAVKGRCGLPRKPVELYPRTAEPLSPELKRRLLELRDRELFFLVRKTGYGYLYCERCDALACCPVCGAFLTYSKEQDRTYCSYAKSHYEQKGRRCPSCGREARETGLGVERAKEELERLLGREVKVGTKIEWSEEYDYAVVLNADAVLSVPSYDAFERFLQLLALALRVSKEGVLVQTAFNEPELLEFIKRGELEGLYELELKKRRERRLPPFYRLAVAEGGPSLKAELELLGLEGSCRGEEGRVVCVLSFRGKEGLLKLIELKKRGYGVRVL